MCVVCIVPADVACTLPVCSVYFTSKEEFPDTSDVFLDKHKPWEKTLVPFLSFLFSMNSLVELNTYSFPILSRTDTTIIPKKSQARITRTENGLSENIRTKGKDKNDPSAVLCTCNRVFHRC